MSVENVVHLLKFSLQEKNGSSLELDTLFAAIDGLINDCLSANESESILLALEEKLQVVHKEVIDHTSIRQIEIFLVTLHRLSPVLSSTSIISTWFDLVLRPALREPKLPSGAVNQAKELVVIAAESADGRRAEKVHGFRRHLLDLYLLDAYNEGSGEDVLEWARLDELQRDMRSLWKFNLRDILVKFGLKQPQVLMTEINTFFATPSSRLQLMILMDYYASQEAFYLPMGDRPSPASILPTHPLMDSMLFSLLLDNSSTVCTIGLTVVIKLLPMFAVYAYEDLKRMLARLLVVLARVLCWKERPAGSRRNSIVADDDVVLPTATETLAAAGEDGEFERPVPTPALRPGLDWKQLELVFHATTSSVPPSESYFTVLYYLFPCNLLRFLRGPTSFLKEHGLESPYAASWEDALDEDNIRSMCEPLLRSHVVSPMIIWHDATEELSKPDSWSGYDVAQIASECMMLSVRNTMLGGRHTPAEPENPSFSTSFPTFGFLSVEQGPDEGTGTGGLTPHQRHLDLPSQRPRVSLQDMMITSVALKSNVDVEIELPTSSVWSTALFHSDSSSPAGRSVSLPPSLGVSKEGEQLPLHVAEAMSGLQREVLLLRNDLNFELWLARENVQHISRLYKNRILSKNAEAERQGLYNKLRQYRAQVQILERELREHKANASSAKNKYADWNTELQKKLHEFREEKRAWITEAAALRSAEKEAKARFAAQGKLLEDASKEVFNLQTRIKEVQHKIDRLRDYERRIEQHERMQRLWDADFAKFNQRADEMKLMLSQYKKMEMRVESYEETMAEMDEDARVQRRKVQSLEAQLANATKKAEGVRALPQAEIAAFVAEKSALGNANGKLREENGELREEIEELRAMVEVLKAQVSGRQGLVSPPRPNPLRTA